MEHLKLAQEIIQYCGGKDNITQAWNCITRLRFHLKDREKADVKAIQTLTGVLGAQFQGDQFQVIIGNEVLKVFEGVKKELGDLVVSSEEKPGKNKKKGKSDQRCFRCDLGHLQPHFTCNNRGRNYKRDSGSADIS